MRDRRDPWKWPFSIGLALAWFLGMVFLLPQPWIDAFFSPLSHLERLDKAPPAGWLVLLPPPPIEMVPDTGAEASNPEHDPEPDGPHRDPDWWFRGWAAPPVVRPPWATPRAAADSVAVLLAARLFLLKIEDSFNFDEWKPYLSALARSRDYADIMSRAADMYDQFLQSKIMTPD